MYSPKPRGVAEPLKSTRARLARLAAAFSVAAISSPKYVGGWVAPLRGAGKAKDDFSPLHSRSRTFVGLVSGRTEEKRGVVALHNHSAVYFHWDGKGYGVVSSEWFDT